MQQSTNKEEQFNSTVERLMARESKKTLSKQEITEKTEQYRFALNSIAASENGHFLLKTWLQACGIFAINTSKDAAELVKQETLRNFYLLFIREHLDADLRSKLEG